MHHTLREYKIPLSVTGAGLIIAAILAFAPALLAESESELLAKKNASDVQALTESIEKRFAEMQQQIDGQSSGKSAALDRLDNQVDILNKAVGRIHGRQVAITGPASELAGEFNSLKSNVQMSLTNLEKAMAS